MWVNCLSGFWYSQFNCHGRARPPLLCCIRGVQWITGKIQDGGLCTICWNPSTTSSAFVNLIYWTTETGDGIGQINNFFRELEDAVAVLDDKYIHGGGRFSTVLRLISSKGMVARSLRQIRGKAIRHLRTRPKLAHPWCGEFTVDMQLELFNSISQDIMQCTRFGHWCREINTQIVYEITDIRKARYLFQGRMDIDGSEVNRAHIFEKAYATF